MNTALDSDEVKTAQQTFAGTVSINDPAIDQALVATAKMGDQQAFETLVKRHRTRIFAIALRYTRVREDAEDVVQQTFQKTFLHLSNFEEKSSFSTWLTRIAINEALMCLRRARALREVFIGDVSSDEETAPHLDVVDASPDPEANYLKREEAEVLSAAIDNLTRQLRTAIKLRELGELSIQETARHMRLSVGAVKGHVFRGKRKLRKTLRDLGINGRGAQPLGVGRVANQNCPSCAMTVAKPRAMLPGRCELTGRAD
jgi:RNA polymerase sigma-70 factor, ECF subfamily